MDWRTIARRALYAACAGLALMTSGIKDAHNFGLTLAVLVAAYAIVRAIRKP